MKQNGEIIKYKHRRMRLVKAKAKELMLAGENHLLLIFSLIIIGVTAILPQLIFSIIYAFFPYLVIDIALVVFSLLLIAPLVYGVLRVAWRSADGEKCTIADLFEAFCSAEDWWRSVWAFTVFLIIAAIEITLLAVSIGIGDWMMEIAVSPWIAKAVGIAGFFGGLFGLLLLNCRMMLFPMLVAKGNGALRAIGSSIRLTKGKTFRLLGYQLGFLPLVAVSVLAVLVPMLIYTAPYMLCAYAIGVKMICENNNE